MSGTIVIDIGKTSAKVSLVDPAGSLVERLERPNAPNVVDGLKRLDADGIDAWLGHALAKIGRGHEVGAIVPVAHGAAAAVLKRGALAMPPLDYEQEIPGGLRAEYDTQRDPFALTGSPSLPVGLNLGAQLHLLEATYPGLLDGDAQIVTWPQYWAWRFCGVAACELTSLGCHSDLWRPLEGKPSGLAQRRGWADLLAPVRRADERLGCLSPEWAERTGLSPETAILCGIHDSNAALVAARGSQQHPGTETTLLSTGTWFVAMRSPGAVSSPSQSDLDERRDCLINVDFAGKPVPSSRFMGGREIQLLLEEDEVQIDDPKVQDAMLDAVAIIVERQAMVLPSLVAGVGPFPDRRGEWQLRPAFAIERASAVALYAALVARETLDLVGARDNIIVDGRFARSSVFARALASLSAPFSLLVGEAESDLALGAARLVDPALPVENVARPVPPLETDLSSYQARWRERLRAKEAV